MIARITLRDGRVVFNRRAIGLALRCILPIPVIIRPPPRNVAPSPTPKERAENDRRSLLISAANAVVRHAEAVDPQERQKWAHVKDADFRSFTKRDCGGDAAEALRLINEAIARWFPNFKPQR